jgi:hypothetical protein
MFVVECKRDHRKLRLYFPGKVDTLWVYGNEGSQFCEVISTLEELWGEIMKILTAVEQKGSLEIINRTVPHSSDNCRVEIDGRCSGREKRYLKDIQKKH